jgi:hypothetical protein
MQRLLRVGVCFAIVLLVLGGVHRQCNAQINSRASRAGARLALGGSDQVRVGVTRVGCDDIPSVLRSLKVPFRMVAESKHPLEDFDVIFVGCGEGWIAGTTTEQVQEFVHDGGVLYVSDLSYPLLQRAFPRDFPAWKCDGWPCKVPCGVLDRELARVIGDHIWLTFDMGSWARATKCSDRVKVLMIAPHNGRSKEVRRSIPVLLTLDHGQGRVIYSSFHNHANASSLERRLIRYLVSQPIRTAENIRAEMSAGVGGLGELAQRHAHDARSESLPPGNMPLTAEKLEGMPAGQLGGMLRSVDEDMQQKILWQLHGRKGGDATQALCQAIDVVSEPLRPAARQLLAQRLTRMKATTLSAYLSHKDSVELRMAAAKAVALKPERSLTSELAELLLDADRAVGNTAHASLVQLTTQRFGKFEEAGVVERYVIYKKWKEWFENNQ